MRRWIPIAIAFVLIAAALLIGAAYVFQSHRDDEQARQTAIDVTPARIENTIEIATRSRIIAPTRDQFEFELTNEGLFKDSNGKGSGPTVTDARGQLVGGVFDDIQVAALLSNYD